jgi:hypothetical protein
MAELLARAYCHQIGGSPEICRVRLSEQLPIRVYTAVHRPHARKRSVERGRLGYVSAGVDPLPRISGHYSPVAWGE